MPIIEGKKVLVVEDERAMGQLLSTIFQREGAACIVSPDGREAIRALSEHQPDLVLLDLMLPGEDGLDVCRRIRDTDDVPIIIISARTRDQDIVKGLKCGADDYITKPFDPQVVTARAEAVLRRRGPLHFEHSKIDYQDDLLLIRLDQHQVLAAGQEVHLTPTEFKLLSYLIENLGRICTFDQIARFVWRDAYMDGNETIHTYIWQLRQKIEPDPKEPTYIITMHGIGYRFVDRARS